jgi:hypothetical protein
MQYRKFQEKMKLYFLTIVIIFFLSCQGIAPQKEILRTSAQMRVLNGLNLDIYQPIVRGEKNNAFFKKSFYGMPSMWS